MYYKDQYKTKDNYQMDVFGSEDDKYEICPDCHGSGSFQDNTCSGCNGSGLI
jgi:DnaJ-class molecular chaperone